MRNVLAVAFVLFLAAGCGEADGPAPDSRPDAPEDVVDAPARPVWSHDTTVGTIVADVPATARLFELVDIDYCCGGDVSLRDAATKAGQDPDRLLAALLTVGPAIGASDETSWQDAPLPDLMDHIVETHHTWLRRELPRIGELVETVADVHGADHPELAQVERVFGEVHEAIGPHLEDEEKRLFPAIRALASGTPPEGVDGMLDAMRTDHDAVGERLHTLRDLTDGYAVPPDACPTYRQMLQGLADLERDLHRHVHLENNVLLPRARALLSE